VAFSPIIFIISSTRGMKMRDGVGSTNAIIGEVDVTSGGGVPEMNVVTKLLSTYHSIKDNNNLYIEHV
jgi:hypothetical protein